MATPLRSSPVLIMRLGSWRWPAGARRGRARVRVLVAPIVAERPDPADRARPRQRRRRRRRAGSGSAARPARRPASSSDEVLDPDAGLALEVDAGLDARRPSGSAAASSVARWPRHGSSWVARPIPWPGPCPKWSPVAGGVDDGSRASASSRRPARQRRHPARDGRLEPLDRRSLGGRDELVDREVAARRLAHEQRPGHVAPVARDLGAEVEQEDLPGDDRADPPASRAAARPPARPGRRRRTRAPRRRRSGSATRVAARARLP